MSERKGDDAVRVPIEIKTEDLDELQQLIQQLTEAEEAARTARASGAALPSKGAAGPQTFGGQAKRTSREGAVGEGPGGIFGGGREGVLQAQYQTGSDRNRAALQAGMLQQGYGVGQQARQQDLMNQLTLGGAQAGLAQGQLGMGTYQQGLAQLAPQLAGGDIGMLSQVGDIQQRQAQNVLEAARAGRQMGAMEPYQRMGVYGQGVASLGQMPGRIETTQTPDQTALQTALGWTSVVGGIMNPRLGIPSA